MSRALLMYALLIGCSGEEHTCPKLPTPAEFEVDHGTLEPVKVVVRDMDVLWRGGAIKVRDVEGLIVGNRVEGPPIIDEPHSYSVSVQHAEIGLPTEGIRHILSNKSSSGRAPVDDARVYTEGEHLVVEGTMRPGGIFLPMRFSIQARPYATPDGQLGIEAAELRLLGIDLDQVMERFDVTLDKVIKLDDHPGLSIRDNSLLINLVALVDAPRLDAFVVDVAVLEDGVAVVLGDGEGYPRPSTLTAVATATDTPLINGIQFTGGNMRFGDVKIIGTHIELIDQDMSDPFLLQPSALKQQLRSGYSKTVEGGIIRLKVPDADEMRPGDVEAPLEEGTFARVPDFLDFPEVTQAQPPSE